MPVLTLNPLNPTALGVNAPVQGDIFGYDGSGWRPKKLPVDVTLFGAKGDGTTDDTAAIQAAANAAILVNGALYFPRPSAQYVVSSTITLQPSSGAQTQLHIVGEGTFTQIKWTGGNNTSVFRTLGWKRSLVQGLHIRLSGNVTGVVGWDIDIDGTRTSTSHLTFQGCRVTSDGTGVKTSCVGWRIGHSSGGVEFSYLTWINCGSEFTSGTDTNCLGWVPEINNGLILNWITCMATGCLEGWTANPTAGAAGTAGSGSWTAVGCGGTGNLTDFRFGRNQEYVVHGGRFENGHQFIQTDFSTTAIAVTVIGTEVSGYAPGVSERFVNLSSSGSVELRNMRVVNIADSASLVQLNNGSAPIRLLIEGGAWDNADPFVFDAQGNNTHRIAIRDVQIIDATGAVTGWYRNKDWPRENIFTITYSATMATDAKNGSDFVITATNGTAFTISNPTGGQTGQTITYTIRNTSGGALGAATWGANFKMAAWTQPGSANSRSISFRYDGTNWIEVGRTTADVPN